MAVDGSHETQKGEGRRYGELKFRGKIAWHPVARSVTAEKGLPTDIPGVAQVSQVRSISLFFT